MKILALDIENSYTQAGVWSLWGQNVYIDQILKSGYMLCWAARFVGEKKMHFYRTGSEGFLTELHKLLDEADAVLTFNGKRHDIPWINKEFIKSGLTPPSPYKHIDLLETAKKQFKFESNKLQFLVQELGLGSKEEHEGFPLWIKCMNGDEKAWKTMTTYNKKDVILLEDLYDKLKPWIANHPNHNLYGATSVCPNCGSSHVQKRGTYKTQTGIYSRIACMNCGAWSRTRFTEIEKSKSREIYTGVALS